MDTNWIEGFLDLCKSQNFRISSEQQCISQPAFSRRIKSLEAWMGTPLIDRSSQPVKLTEAGILFKPIAQEIVRLAYLSRNNIEVKVREEKEKIRFSTVSTLAQFFMPAWLKGLQSDIQSELFSVRTDFANVKDYLCGLDEGEVDLFICYVDPSETVLYDTGKYTSLRLGGEILVPVVSSDSEGNPRWWLPSTQQGVIPYLQTQFTPSMWPVRHHLEKRYSHLSFLLVYEATIATALRSMVIEGYGVAWIPKSIIVEDLESGLVVRAGDENDEIKLDINIYRHANFIAPQAEKFWEVLVQRAGQLDG